MLSYLGWNHSGAFFNNLRIHEKAVLFRNPRPIVYIPDDLGQGNHDLITAGLNRLGEHHAVGGSINLEYCIGVLPANAYNEKPLLGTPKWGYKMTLGLDARIDDYGFSPYEGSIAIGE